MGWPENTLQAADSIRFLWEGTLPSRYPCTFIWRARYTAYLTGPDRGQIGYYTAFFRGNNGNFLWNAGAPDSYYGGHPYPFSPPSGRTHRFEVSVEGGDIPSDPGPGDDNGNDISVVYGQWYRHALVVDDTGSGKRHRFYWNLAAGTNRIITWTAAASYGEATPPSDCIVWGDAAWSPGNEGFGGDCRGIQIYEAAKSAAQCSALAALETNAQTLASSDNANLWFLNMNPTPSDITDKSGAGHSPSWVNANRPSLVSL